MITKQLIENIREYAISQIKKYGLPSKFHFELSNKKGQILAKQLKADSKIVLLGTMLMDCRLGYAFSRGKLNEHIKLSQQKAKQLLSSDKQITKEETVNILACIREHHGINKFFSKESEICCNADCYRFCSIKGFIAGLVYGPKLPLDDLLKLLSDKNDEKWNLVSIPSVKKELKLQYFIIKSVITNYYLR